MAEKTPNFGFTDRLKKALNDRGVYWDKGSSRNLKSWATSKENIEHGVVYQTLNTTLNKNGHVPKWTTLVSLSRALDCSIDWLLTGEDPGTSNIVSLTSHQKKVTEFLVPERGEAINELLLEMERIEIRALDAVKDHLTSMLSGIKIAKKSAQYNGPERRERDDHEGVPETGDRRKRYGGAGK